MLHNEGKSRIMH